MEIKDLCKPRPRRQPGLIRGWAVSLRGLGKKEFPFTVVRYDEQRVGEQKGKGFSRARNAPSSSGFLVFCSSAGQIIPRKLKDTG